MKKLISIVVAVFLVLVWGNFLPLQAADEHPKTQEHPKTEHPAKKLTTEDIDGAIRAHITEQSKADSMFHVKDNVLNKTWNLTLVKVHKDKLTALDAKTYFACVDFKADDGTKVDVDFYLKNEAGKLVVTDTTVHKINGQARFMYQKKDDYWIRVDTEGKEPESQEQPQTQ